MAISQQRDEACLACRDRLSQDSAKAVHKPNRRKGWWGRYLDRLAKSNAKQFGRSGPTCCG